MEIHLIPWEGLLTAITTATRNSIPSSSGRCMSQICSVLMASLQLKISPKLSITPTTSLMDPITANVEESTTNIDYRTYFLLKSNKRNKINKKVKEKWWPLHEDFNKCPNNRVICGYVIRKVDTKIKNWIGQVRNWGCSPYYSNGSSYRRRSVPSTKTKNSHRAHSPRTTHHFAAFGAPTNILSILPWKSTLPDWGYSYSGIFRSSAGVLWCVSQPFFPYGWSIEDWPIAPAGPSCSGCPLGATGRWWRCS